MTNEDRAERASAALGAYCSHTGDPRSAFSQRELIGDMICDLMHYAQSVGVPFAEVLQIGELNFNAECDEEAEADTRANCERCGALDQLEDYDGESLCTDCQHAAQDGSLHEGKEDDEDDEDDTPTDQPRRFTARVWRREMIVSSEDVVVMAHSRAEARQLITDGEIEDATNWEVSDTISTDLEQIDQLEEW